MAKQIEAEVETRTFEEYVTEGGITGQLPHLKIVNQINMNTFPFWKNKFFSYNPAKLGAEEFVRCTEIYNRRSAGKSAMDAMNLMDEIFQLETPYRKQLEDLAIEIVRSIFEIPNSIDLKAFIEDTTQDAEDFQDGECEPDEPISVERKLELQPEIEKRRILNSICHGASILIFTSAYYLSQEEINKLHPNLFQKYDELTSLVNYWNWKMLIPEVFSDGNVPLVQGHCDCDVDKKEITAHGLSYPIILHELVKGCFSYITSVSIPNIKESELKFLYNEADKFSHECWHYFLGTPLYSHLLTACNSGPASLIPIVSYMSKIEYEELSELCIDICFHEEVGKMKIDKIKKEVL
jgi:hypothetical protein